DHRALDGGTEQAASRDGREDRDPHRQGQAGGEREEHVRAEHQHLADREVHDARGLVDHHESQAGQRVQAAGAEARQRDLEQEQPVERHAALLAAAACSLRRNSATSPDPRYARMTSGAFCTDGGAPSAITCPKFSTTTWSEMSMTIPMSCSTISTVTPHSARRSRMKRAMSSVSSRF